MVAKDLRARSVAAAVVWMLAGLTYLIMEAVAAAAYRPPYSYTHDFISDLGVPGAHSPLAWSMNVAFCVQGTLFLVGAVRTAPGKPLRFILFAAANAVGNLLIAIFHSGSATHAVGAVSAIVGGNAAILAGSSILGGWHRKASIGLGVFGLFSFAVFVIGLKSASLPLGVLERCSVYPITGWQLLNGACLLSRRPKPWPGRARRV